MSLSFSLKGAKVKQVRVKSDDVTSGLLNAPFVENESNERRRRLQEAALRQTGSSLAHLNLGHSFSFHSTLRNAREEKILDCSCSGNRNGIETTTSD